MRGVHPYRATRSLARTGAQIQKAHELRHPPTNTERAAWCLLRSIKFVQKILDAVWSLPEAFG
ncbi:MAG: hypothetical protein ACLQVG_03385 [Terriglobia bacterium]